MNIICIQVGYMAGGAGISWLARINDYMDPTDVGGPATPRSPRLALYPFTPSCLPSLSPSLRTLALSQNALVMARPYNLWIPANRPKRAPYANYRAISSRWCLTPRNQRVFKFFQASRSPISRI